MQSLQHEITQHLKSNNGQLASQKLNQLFPSVQQSSIVKVINRMASQFKISIFQNDEQIYYKLQSIQQASKRKELEYDQLHILQVVEQSGSAGITVAEIKNKLNMTTVAINKILQKLKRKSFVKTINSVQQKSKKLWFLIDVEPNREISGGVWYSDQEMNYVLIDTFYEKTFEFVKQNKGSKKKEIFEYLRSLGLSQNALRDEDLNQIITLLQIDGKLQQIRSNEYKTCNNYYPKPTIALSPCTLCPLQRQCKPGSKVISPQTCKYLNEWIQF